MAIPSLESVSTVRAPGSLRAAAQDPSTRAVRLVSEWTVSPEGRGGDRLEIAEGTPAPAPRGQVRRIRTEALLPGTRVRPGGRSRIAILTGTSWVIFSTFPVVFSGGDPDSTAALAPPITLT